MSTLGSMFGHRRRLLGILVEMDLVAMDLEASEPVVVLRIEKMLQED